jgi:hypothetical protein
VHRKSTVCMESLCATLGNLKKCIKMCVEARIDIPR